MKLRLRRWAAKAVFLPCIYFAVVFFSCTFLQCKLTAAVPGDAIDNDCDGKIDEEIKDGKDNDGDGKVDEDLDLVSGQLGFFLYHLFTISPLIYP